MLRIMEIDSEEKFKKVREKEVIEHDYLYILKHSGQIKMSDNGTLRNFSKMAICESQEDYDAIEEKEDIMYLVVKEEGTYKLYYGTGLIFETQKEYTKDEVDTAIDDVISSLNKDEETPEEKEDLEEEIEGDVIE